MIEELHYPVSSEELDEYHAGEADFSNDRWGNRTAPIVEEAKRALQGLEDRDHVFEPYVDEAWYYQQLIALADRLGKFVAEYEVASPALCDAMSFGALSAELELRRLTRLQRAEATHAAHVEGGKIANRKRPRDDDYTRSIWDREYAATKLKGLADERTAMILSQMSHRQISARTVRAVRSGKR